MKTKQTNTELLIAANDNAGAPRAVEVTLFGLVDLLVARHAQDAANVNAQPRSRT